MITAVIVLSFFYSPVLQDYIHLLQGEQQGLGSKHVAPVHSDSALTAPHTPNTCMKIITITCFLSTNQNIVYFTTKSKHSIFYPLQINSSISFQLLSLLSLLLAFQNQIFLQFLDLFLNILYNWLFGNF